jgi:crotonobetainyl-CoA:carnitine CoA-transferase CaiB-like acyl-CoA transferase
MSGAERGGGGSALPAAGSWGPLTGIRVIDFTQMMAGPYATMLLGDLGAEIIKIEPPGEGDVTRMTGPVRGPDPAPLFGSYFQSVNRNKKSIVLDLKTETGKRIVRELVATADMLVENYRAGVMDRLGLSYESLLEINPALVYASVRGFGDPRGGESPYVDWPLYDINAQAAGGVMGITGDPDGEPCKVGPGVGDIFPGSLLIVGALAALVHARATGEGQYVDVAMYDAMLSLSERIVYQYSYGGEVPDRDGNGHPFVVPFDVIEVSDGHVTIACARDKQWLELCRAMDRPDLLTDERYLTRPARNANRIEVRKIVADWAGKLTKREVVAALGGKVPVAAVNTAADIFEDPHVAARDMLVEVEHPGTDRPGVIAGSAIKLTKTPGGVRSRAPLLNENGEEILRSLGYPDEEIARILAG